MPFRDDELPFLTCDVQGVGGRLKDEADDFRVVERMELETLAGGPHVRIDLERSGLTTFEVVDRLAAILSISPRDVGYAGMKDRHARTRQSFSVPRESQTEPQIEALLAPAADLCVHGVSGIAKKIRRGQNAGNAFTLRLRGVRHDPGAVAEIAAAIGRRGCPNYFGAQRFGARGDNAEQGRAILGGRRISDRRLRKLLLNAWQSELFNRWLGRRIEDGTLCEASAGDVMTVEGRGGRFLVEDPATETDRCRRGETTLTGPMFGADMMAAAGEPGARERELLAAQKVDPAAFARARLAGTRRAARIFPGNLEWSYEEEDVLSLTFALPRGSYATSVAREFMKNERS